MIPGIKSAIAGAGVGPLSFTFIAVSYGTNTLALPAGAQAGDFAVFGQFVENGSQSGGAPSDFTTLITTGGTSYFSIVAYKVLTGAETDLNNTGASAKTICLLFRPSRSFSAVSIVDSTVATWWQTHNLTLSADSLASTAPVLSFAFHGAPWSVPARASSSPAMDDKVYSNTHFVAQYHVANEVADRHDFSVTLTDGGSNQKSLIVAIEFAD